jgi:hypothetical protein
MYETCLCVNSIWNSDLATDCTEIEGSDFDYQKGQKAFLIFKASRPSLSPTQPPTQPVLREKGSSPGLGRSAREAETQQLQLAV